MSRAGLQLQRVPLPRRERILVLSALLALSAWAWIWLLTMPGMDRLSIGDEMMRPQVGTWSFAHAVAMFAMWVIMMVGMMIPSAAPMVLLFARVAHHSLGGWRAHLRIGLFIAGYIAVWTVFALAATMAQWGLERAALITPMMKAASPLLGGALLGAAGLYQLTPLKRTCLEQCRAPFAFVTERWRAGAGGAFVMGLDHGLYCLGCCWALMALLFVVGVMNLLWVAIIAAFVLAEKIAPAGHWLARISGIGLIGLGVYLMSGGSGTMP